MNPHVPQADLGPCAPRTFWTGSESVLKVRQGADGSRHPSVSSWVIVTCDPRAGRRWREDPTA